MTSDAAGTGRVVDCISMGGESPLFKLRGWEKRCAAPWGRQERAHSPAGAGGVGRLARWVNTWQFALLLSRCGRLLQPPTCSIHSGQHVPLPAHSHTLPIATPSDPPTQQQLRRTRDKALPLLHRTRRLRWNAQTLHLHLAPSGADYCWFWSQVCWDAARHGAGLVRCTAGGRAAFGARLGVGHATCSPALLTCV